MRLSVICIWWLAGSRVIERFSTRSVRWLGRWWSLSRNLGSENIKLHIQYSVFMNVTCHRLVNPHLKIKCLVLFCLSYWYFYIIKKIVQDASLSRPFKSKLLQLFLFSFLVCKCSHSCDLLLNYFTNNVSDCRLRKLSRLCLQTHCFKKVVGQNLQAHMRFSPL